MSSVSAYVFPQGIKVSGIPDTDQGYTSFIESFLIDNTTSSVGAADSSGASFHVESVTVPTILICSHMSRDARCGVLGPLLYNEFEKQLNRQGIAKILLVIVSYDNRISLMLLCKETKEAG